jgi:peroxiredoxin
MALFGKHVKLLKAGSRAPDFRLARLDGGETALADIAANGPALLAFFKVSCPVCQLTFPFLARIHSAALPVYGISQNGPEDTRDFNRRFGVTFPVLLDSERGGFPASNGFGISTVPTLFLVERDGSVSRVVEGWSKKDVEWLGSRAGVNVFRAEEDVPAWKAG